MPSSLSLHTGPGQRILHSILLAWQNADMLFNLPMPNISKPLCMHVCLLTFCRSPLLQTVDSKLTLNATAVKLLSNCLYIDIQNYFVFAVAVHSAQVSAEPTWKHDPAC